MRIIPVSSPSPRTCFHVTPGGGCPRDANTRIQLVPGSNSSSPAYPGRQICSRSSSKTNYGTVPSPFMIKTPPSTIGRFMRSFRASWSPCCCVRPTAASPPTVRRTSPHGGLTDFVGIAGTQTKRKDGMFHPNYNVRLRDVTDGTSSTVMIGERPPGPSGTPRRRWFSKSGCLCPSSQILHAGINDIYYRGINCDLSTDPLRPGTLGNDCDSGHFWSLHPGGANFAFADGSVRFLRYSASDILPALATRAGQRR